LRALQKEGAAMNDIIDVQTNDERPRACARPRLGQLPAAPDRGGGRGHSGRAGQALRCCFIALIIDLVKQGDADGTWQASHFSWRIRTVIWAGVLYAVTAPLWLLLFCPAGSPGG
jgi:hypothetical protein